MRSLDDHVCMFAQSFMNTCTLIKYGFEYVDTSSFHTFVACMQHAGDAQLWCPQQTSFESVFNYCGTVISSSQHKLRHVWQANE